MVENLRKHFKVELIVHSILLSGMLIVNSISNFTPAIYLAAILLAGSCVLYLATSKNKEAVKNYHQFLQLHRIRIYTFLLFIFIWPGLTLFYSANPQYGLQKILIMLVSAIPLFYYAGFLLFTYTEENFTSLLTAMMGLGLVLALGALFLQNFRPGEAYSFSITRWSHVTTGRFLTILLLPALWFFLKEKKLYLIVFYGLFFFSGISVVGISSFRAGILWILLMTPMLFGIALFISENKKEIIIKAASIILLSAGLAIFATKSENAAVEHRYHALINILTGDHETQDGSINARVDAAKLSFRMLKENLWIGTGFGGFAQEFDGNSTGIVNKYPHNIILEVFVELGVIYGGVFCIMIVYTIYRIAKRKEIIYLILFLTVLWLAMFSKHFSTNAGVVFGVLSSWFLVRGS